MKILGVLLIVIGMLALAYQGISYTTREEVVDFGPVEVTKEDRHTIPLPPLAGGAAVACGVIVLLLRRRNG